MQQRAAESCRDSPLSVGGRLGPLHLVMGMHSQLSPVIHHGHNAFFWHHEKSPIIRGKWDCGFDLDTTCRGQGSIIHTAALHAPNLDFYTEADFRRINLDGTRHVLNAARKMGETAAVVFSSTTSLMNTQEVKEETR